MILRRALIGVALLAAGAATADPALPNPASPNPASPNPALPNPAAALCAKNGATVTIETQPNGSQRGICVFPNGTRIDEWAYFRNKHRTR